MFRWAIVLLFVVSVALPAGELAAQSGTGSQSNTPGGPDLKTTLEKGLKARRQVEFDFIALVVSRVNSGALPRSLVNSTFLWARRHQPFPFPYFERGLKERAKKAGITI